MRANGWTELYDWHIDRASNTPIFRQIYLQARAAILSRTFSAGAKLPSTRELASRLRVARASVVAAYEQLFAEGYLSGKIGSGTYVSFDLPEPVDRCAPNNGTPRNRKRRTYRAERSPFANSPRRRCKTTIDRSIPDARWSTYVRSRSGGR
jgi:GntR family transcriptional regulator/MocR family aminotransferase